MENQEPDVTMDVTKVPFVKHVGIERCDPAERALLMLPESERCSNHLNTVHASAQFALGEATSGEYLLRRFGHLLKTRTCVAVVRHADVKFKKPAVGALKGTASIADSVANQTVVALKTRGWALIPVPVQLTDGSDNTTMTATYGWFIKKHDTQPA
jgi:hypothetical protein